MNNKVPSAQSQELSKKSRLSKAEGGQNNAMYASPATRGSAFPIPPTSFPLNPLKQAPAGSRSRGGGCCDVLNIKQLSLPTSFYPILVSVLQLWVRKCMLYSFLSPTFAHVVSTSADCLACMFFNCGLENGHHQTKSQIGG